MLVLKAISNFWPPLSYGTSHWVRVLETPLPWKIKHSRGGDFRAECLTQSQVEWQDGSLEVQRSPVYEL